MSSLENKINFSPLQRKPSLLSDSAESHPKLKQLRSFLIPLLREGLIVAFSGGVDSGFLLWQAKEALDSMRSQGEGGKLIALTTTSAAVPPWEMEEADAFAKSLGVEHVVTQSGELEQEAYARNDQNRCYYCKSELFNISSRFARDHEFKHISYGYNASDRADVRPGHKAAQEHLVHAPLNVANLAKEEIREFLKAAGLALAEKPASPCLSSRVMTGVRVTSEKLRDIQRMEELLRGAGIKIFRVRLHDEVSGLQNGKSIPYFRIEVAPDEIPAIFPVRERLIEEARSRGYRWVTLDLAGYKMGGANL